MHCERWLAFDRAAEVLYGATLGPGNIGWMSRESIPIAILAVDFFVSSNCVLRNPSHVLVQHPSDPTVTVACIAVLGWYLGPKGGDLFGAALIPGKSPMLTCNSFCLVW